MTSDVLILGAGPAGCSAALTLRQRDIGVTVLYAGAGALARARRVENYPGLPGRTGEEMLRLFRGQAEAAGAGLKEGLARLVQRSARGFTVLCGEELLTCRALLLATGARTASPLPGEEELVGQGVSYCATCDGMLYRGGRVAVIARSESARLDYDFLRRICTVDYYAEKPHAAPEGARVRDGAPRALRREGDAVAVVTDAGEARYDCVFILRPSVSLHTLLPHLALRDGAVAVDANLRTSLPGVFAAGDVTGAPYQAARAVGEGNLAALSIAQYLHEGDGNQ